MINSEFYKLRALEKGDLEQILEWRNSDRIRNSMFSDQIITMEEHVRWFDRLKMNNDKTCQVFLVCNIPVGIVCFSINRTGKNCKWGFYIGSESQPKGTGTILGLLGLEYAFESLGLHKMYGEVLATNKISINFHKKLGFIQEANFKDHVIKNNRYEDVIVFGQLFNDWEINKRKWINNIL